MLSMFSCVPWGVLKIGLLSAGHGFGVTLDEIKKWNKLDILSQRSYGCSHGVLNNVSFV